MPIAHFVFKQSVHNVSAHQLQQHTIKVCCKMIHCLIDKLVKQIILYRQQNVFFLGIMLASFGMCL